MPYFPAGGRVLDLAAGLGEDASWLRQEGYDAHALDVSPVAAARAAERDPGLPFRVADLDDWQPTESWDVILTLHFLDRGLWHRIREALSPGGLYVAEVLTEGTPFGRSFQAARGELLRAFVDWDVLAWEVAQPDERVLSRLLVRRP